MKDHLGSLPLSQDLFTKGKLGLWALEIDADALPRLYADASVLNILGADPGMSPEEVYDLWCDHVDENAYDLINSIGNRIIAGEYAEVQYLWYHPDGRTRTFRSSGIRNNEYTKGLRLEGIHRDVTDLARFHAEEEKFLQERRFHDLFVILNDELEALYDIDLQSGEYETYVKEATWYRKLNEQGADQIDFFREFRRLAEKRVCAEEQQALFSFCSRENIIETLEQAAFSDYYFRADVKGCLSWLRMRIAYRDESRERLILGIFNAEKEMEAKLAEKRAEENLRASREAEKLTATFLRDYVSVYKVDLLTGKYVPLKCTLDNAEHFRITEDFRLNFGKYIEARVYESDKEMLRHETEFSVIAEKIKENGSYALEYRAYAEGMNFWHYLKVGAVSDHEVILGFREDDKDILLQHIMAELREKYEAVYIVDFDAEMIRVVKASGYLLGEEEYLPYRETVLGFAKGLSEEGRACFERVADPEKAKEILKRDGWEENIYLSPYYAGGPIWLKTEVHVLTWKDGVPETAALIVMKADRQQAERMQLVDIISKQRSKLEESLTISNYFLRSFVSAYYLDLRNADYTILYRTEELQKEYPEDLDYYTSINSYIDACVHPDDREKLHAIVSLENIRATIKEKGMYSEVYREVCFEAWNGVRYYRLLIIPGVDEDHVCYGFQDVTIETQKDNALLSANQSLKLLIASIRQLFPLILTANYDNATFEGIEYENFIINEEAPSNELDSLIEHWAQHIPNDDERAEFLSLFSRDATVKAYREGKQELTLRHQLAGSDGVVHWVQASCILSEVNGTLQSVILARVIDWEVEAERNNQLQLEEALKRAEVANRAKTSFLFNMSHDIRTPMNAIIGFTDIALKHIDKKERVTDSLQKTKIAGNLLLSLINDILDMSRIETGRITLNKNPGDVFMSFTELEVTMKELARAKNIDLQFSVENIRDRYVYCDFSHCVRVFVNIISNAIKYTNNGGKVKVACEQIGRDGNFGVYRYTITDNGIGMSEEFQRHAFEEFSRERTSTVSGVQGSGLGLAVSKTFVEAMNGTISCVSKPGEGSTFTVTLPFEIQEGASFTNPESGAVVRLNTEDPLRTAFVLKGKRILLVEDNELNREIAEAILEDEEMLVETAEDGTVSVELLKEKGPYYYDAILMDIQMPNMNGYEATQCIREMYPDNQIPIIALSANAYAEDVALSLKSGMNDHVAKPINISELKKKLAKYMK